MELERKLEGTSQEANPTNPTSPTNPNPANPNPRLINPQRLQVQKEPREGILLRKETVLQTQTQTGTERRQTEAEMEETQTQTGRGRKQKETEKGDRLTEKLRKEEVTETNKAKAQKVKQKKIQKKIAQTGSPNLTSLPVKTEERIQLLIKGPRWRQEQEEDWALLQKIRVLVAQLEEQKNPSQIQGKNKTGANPVKNLSLGLV